LNCKVGSSVMNNIFSYQEYDTDLPLLFDMYIYRHTMPSSYPKASKLVIA
jgi:hypothetical protein